MGEYKSHRVKVANLPKAKSLCSVGNKEISTLIIIWTIALASMFIFKNVLTAIPVLAYGFFLALRPYKGIFEGYNSFFVIYDQSKKDECDLIYLSELKYWSCEGNFFNPSIKFFLNDGQKIYLEKAVDSKISDYFRKVAPKKEIKKKK